MKIKTVILIAITALSCHKKFESERASWKQGDASEKLALIEKQEWSENSNELILQNEKIVLTRQSVLGIPIENSYLKKRFKKENGRFDLLSAEASIVSPPPVRGIANYKFNENEIIARVQNYKTNFSKISVISSGMVFVQRDKVLVPAFKISFFDRLGEPWSAFADRKNMIFAINREGSHFSEKVSVETTVYPLGPKRSTLTDVLLYNLNLEPTLSTPEVLVMTEADKKILGLDQSLKFDPKDVRFDQVQAFYFLNRALTWMKEKFGIAFARQLEVVVHVGFPEKTNAAFYYQNKIRLGAGDEQSYSQIPQDPSIISHESFHYLIEQVAGLPYDGEGGSLNEAFADFFTCAMLNRPFLADSSYLKGPFKRSLETQTLVSEKNGGLYHDSLIVSSLFWDISQKIGLDKTVPLALEILKTMHRFSDFQDFNEKTLQKIKEMLNKQDADNAFVILKKRGFVSTLD